MNDFGTLFTNSPTLINQNTLTVGAGGISLSADAIINNYGTIVTGGLLEVLQESSLHNYNQITLLDGGDFEDSDIFKDSNGTNHYGSVTNSGTIEVVGGTLNVEVAVANAGGTIQVDNGATLKLSSAIAASTTITGGNLTLGSGSTLDIEKGAPGPGATLDGVTIVGSGTTSTIDVGTTASGATVALLDDGTSVKNATLNIAAGSTLDIEKGATGPGATLDGVTIVGSGTTSTIDVGTTASGTTVALLDDGTSIKNATLNIAAGSTLDIEKGATGPGATLDGVTVVGNGTTGAGASTIDVGTTPSGVTLTLDDATSITGGQLLFGGSSDRIFVGTGGATLDGLTVSGGGETDVGSATATGVTLTLDGATSITGGELVFADSSDKVLVGSGGATLNDVTVTGGGETDVGSATATTLTLDGATSITGGKLVFADSSDKVLVGAGGATLNDVTVTGAGETDVGSATVTGVTLTLDGGSLITGGKLVFADSSDKVLVGTGGATLNDVTVTGGGETDIGSATVTGVTLTLDGATIIGGTINDGTSTAGGIIHVTADSTIEGVVNGLVTTNASLSNGAVNIDANTTLKLDNVTVTGTAFNDTANAASSIIQIDTGDTLQLQGGASVTGGRLVNDGTLQIETTSGATLDGVTVSGGGAINVDGTANDTGPGSPPAPTPATLTLVDGTSITGGTLTNGSVGTLDIEKGLTALAMGAPDATLDNVTIVGGGAIEVSETTAGAILTLADGTTVTGGTLDIATGGEVYIQNGSGTVGATLDHVTVTGGGEIEIGNATSSGSTLILSDGTTISGVTLTLNDTTDVVDIEAGTNGNGITLTGMKVSSSGTLSISDDAILTLSGATIDGGVINNGATSGTGHIDVSGLSAITNDILSNGDVTIASDATLTLDGDTVNGTAISGTDLTSIIQIDGHTKLTLNGATIKNATINDFKTSGGIIPGDIEVTGSSTISGAALNNGTVTIASSTALTLDNDTVAGATITGTDATSIIQVGVSTTSASTLTLDNGAIIKNGTLTIDALSTLGVEGTLGATLDGVAVTNGGNIDIGTASTSDDPPLTLEDNTVITNGTMALGSLGVLDVEKGTATLTAGTPDATLDHVSVVSSAAGSAITVGASGAATLLLTDGASTSNVNVTVDSGSTLDLDSSTIHGGTLNIVGELDSTGTSFITGATIINPSHIDVVSGTLTIDPAPVTNTGTIEVKGDSTLVLNDEIITNTDDTTKGVIKVDADLTHTATLDLEGSTIHGGTVTIAGVLDSTGDSFITGATITNTGTIDVTGGTLTIDATSTLDNTGGTLETNGGNLIIDAAIVGSLDIKGGAVLELGSSLANAYSQVTVTFEPGATGTLKLDHSETFNGTVAGLDDNTIDLVDVAYGSNPTVSYAGNASGGILSVFAGGVDVSNIKLTGDYLGVHWTSHR